MTYMHVCKCIYVFYNLILYITEYLYISAVILAQILEKCSTDREKWITTHQVLCICCYIPLWFECAWEAKFYSSQFNFKYPLWTLFTLYRKGGNANERAKDVRLLMFGSCTHLLLLSVLSHTHGAQLSTSSSPPTPEL